MKNFQIIAKLASKGLDKLFELQVAAKSSNASSDTMALIEAAIREAKDDEQAAAFDRAVSSFGRRA